VFFAHIYTIFGALKRNVHFSFIQY